MFPDQITLDEAFRGFQVIWEAASRLTFGPRHLKPDTAQVRAIIRVQAPRADDGYFTIREESSDRARQKISLYHGDNDTAFYERIKINRTFGITSTEIDWGKPLWGQDVCAWENLQQTTHFADEKGAQYNHSLEARLRIDRESTAIITESLHVTSSKGVHTECSRKRMYSERETTLPPARIIYTLREHNRSLQETSLNRGQTDAIQEKVEVIFAGFEAERQKLDAIRIRSPQRKLVTSKSFGLPVLKIMLGDK